MRTVVIEHQINDHSSLGYCIYQTTTIQIKEVATSHTVGWIVLLCIYGGGMMETVIGSVEYKASVAIDRMMASVIGTKIHNETKVVTRAEQQHNYHHDDVS